MKSLTLRISPLLLAVAVFLGAAVTSGATTIAIDYASRLVKGDLLVQAGSSGTFATTETLLSVDTTARQAASCAGNVDIANPYSVPATALINTNRGGVRFHFAGTTANNANAKSINVKWGSQVIVTKALTASIAGFWEIEGHCYRSGASTQQCYAKAFNSGGTTVAAADGATVLYQAATLSGTQTDTAAISVRVQEVTCTAASDIVQTVGKVWFDN